MQIRPLLSGDAPAVAGIYAFHVRHGTGTFEEEPPSPGEMAERIAAVLDRRWPWLVAVAGGDVLGYAYAAQFKARSGYRFACEDSVYVRRDAAGRGIGSALLGALIEAAAAAGFRRMFAVIGDSANAASIALHAAYGFDHAGVLKDAGYKFGRWLDVVHMQRTIAEMS